MRNLRLYYSIAIVCVIVVITLPAILSIAANEPDWQWELLPIAIMVVVLLISTVRIYLPAERQMREQTERLQQQLQNLEAAHYALSIEHARYASLFAQTNDAIVFQNDKGELIAFNDRAVEMFGYSRAELLTMTRWDILIPEMYDNSSDVLKRLLAGENVPVYEALLRHKNGTIFPVEINVALVRNPDGTPLYIQSMVRDIRERKRIEAQELELRLEREKVNLLTGIGRAISHDLRTPLSVINLTVHLLVKQENEEQRRIRAEKIEEQVKRLNAMIDDLQMIVRLEAGVAFETELVDLNDIIDSIEHDLNRNSVSKSHSVHIDHASEKVQVCGNVHYLTTGIAEVVENAILYTPPNGSIILRTSRHEGKARIEVQDNGIGIPPEHIPQIFEPFYKVNEARTSNESRGGMGLAIAKKIVSSHQGTISVLSEQDSGTRFVIELPLAEHSHLNGNQ